MQTLLCAVIALMVFVNTGSACAEGSDSALNTIVTLSAHRLELAQKIALAKWDRGLAVEDPSRETMVILDAAKQAQAAGIDAPSAERFFRAQIEANKIIQFALLADWHRSGRVPEHVHIDLSGEIRPELDRLQAQLIQQLAKTSDLRGSERCWEDVAKAVEAYLRRHNQSADSLLGVALDRAMAGICTKLPLKPLPR